MLKKILKTKKKLILNENMQLFKKEMCLKAEKTRKPKNILYTKFLGSLIKKGNKDAASRTLRDAFLKVSKKTKVPVYRIFSRIFKGLDTYVEVKTIKKRKFTSYIPFPVKKKRNQFLKVKYILDAAKEDTRSVKFSDKLSVEILNLLYKKKKSKVLARKKAVMKDVLKHKANAHFRW